MNIICNDFDIKEIHNSIMQMDISKCPWVWFEFNTLKTLIILPTLNSNIESLFSVLKFRFVGIKLLLTAVVRCWLKTLLHRFALTNKSETSWLPSNSGGITGILVPFYKCFYDWPVGFRCPCRVITFFREAFIACKLRRTHYIWHICCNSY